MKTLREIYSEHTGKASYKWDIYLNEYEKFFYQYRDRPINLLEIGIQNGGSLEVWAKFFPKAHKIIGCDIDSKCLELKYTEQNINVIVGDANNYQAQQSIIALAPSYDIVIDDGSHNSSDIIKTFLNYFPMINDGGVFIAEDLCCSYWSDYEGGIFYPYSSINFFKNLIDIINFEHWGINTTSREDLLSHFKDCFGVSINENILKEIHSVQFVNSMCIIHKSKASNNILGEGHVFGTEAIIDKELLQNAAGKFLVAPSQINNEWSKNKLSPQSFFEEKVKKINKQETYLLTKTSHTIKKIEFVIFHPFKFSKKYKNCLFRENKNTTD
jgi:hypothetical protein